MICPAAFAQAEESEADTVLVTATPEELAEIMEAKTFEAADGKTVLPYRLFVPEGGGTNLPVFLAMHGAGGRGDDNRRTLFHSPWAVHGVMAPTVRKAHPCVVIAPQCPGPKRWVDVDWRACVYSIEEVTIAPEQQAVVELLEAVLKETGADRKRVYAGGFSMGGYGTWDLVTRFPDTFAAAVPVCGGCDPSQSAAIKDVAVWAFHGDNDRVVPPKGTRAMAAALADSESFTYTELPGVGHNAWTPAWKRQDVIDWLFSQAKP